MMLDEATRSQALARIERVYRQRMHDGRARGLVDDDAPRVLDRLRAAEYGKALARVGLLPLGTRDVLDVGAQWGTWLSHCRREWGQEGGLLCGIELMPEWVEKGRRLYPFLGLRPGSADQLPWEADSFDVLHQGMLFSSVLDPGLREAIAAEIARVLRPGGHLVWYDFFFNPLNADTLAMTRARVVSLFPGWRIVHRTRVTPAAPAARLAERVGMRAVRWLSAVKLLNFHHLMVLNKPIG